MVTTERVTTEPAARLANRMGRECPRQSIRTVEMNMRYFVLVVFFVSFVSNALAADKPNFVWLISEDNSKHFLRHFDEHGAPTPHIEALAKHGLTFDHAFSNAPVCSTARTTLMTSCYGPRIGTQFHRRSVTVPMPEGQRMFPAYLRDAGYYTTNKHKTDYNAVVGADVWDDSSPKASWRNRSPGQPFFHKQSFATSHEGKLHFPQADVASRPTKTDPGTVFVAPYHPDTPTFRYTYARYHDLIQAVDREIGEVVSQLASDGLLADTFVFYFGDHGGVLPRGKGYAYESGLHVPLVVRVPENWQHLVDARVGDRIQGFVSFVDFGPTLLNLAGISIPDGIDGRPFLGAETIMSAVHRRDEAFGYADRFDEKYDFVRTLRKGKFKYVRNYQPFNFDGLQNNYRYKMAAYAQWRHLFRQGKLNEIQSQFFRRRSPEALYDLENDPHEIRDLSGDPDHAETLAAARSRLGEIVRDLPDLSFYPESHLVDEVFAEPVPYGQSHRGEIARLADIADLSLKPFYQVEGDLIVALNSDDPWQRYWGLISCSSHGKATGTIVDLAKRVSAKDPNLLVRTRAAEFLGLVGAESPQATLIDCLHKTRSPVEANLILNSLVLLRDGEPSYTFDISWGSLPLIRRENAGVAARRIEYLTMP